MLPNQGGTKQPSARLFGKQELTLTSQGHSCAMCRDCNDCCCLVMDGQETRFAFVYFVLACILLFFGMLGWEVGLRYKLVSSKYLETPASVCLSRIGYSQFASTILWPSILPKGSLREIHWPIWRGCRNSGVRMRESWSWGWCLMLTITSHHVWGHSEELPSISLLGSHPSPWTSAWKLSKLAGENPHGGLAAQWFTYIEFVEISDWCLYSLIQDDVTVRYDSLWMFMHLCPE